MDFKKMIKENVILPANSDFLKPCVGTIESVDYEKNRAVVKIDNQFSSGYQIIENVVLPYGNGVKLHYFTPGDKVFIIFVNGSVSSPYIVSCADDLRKNKQDFYHPHQSIIKSIEDKKAELHYNLTLKDLILKRKKKITDYERGINVQEIINESFFRIGQYDDKDIGITHPASKSSLVFKENGDIIISNALDYSLVFKKDGDIVISGKKVSIVSDSKVEIIERV